MWLHQSNHGEDNSSLLPAREFRDRSHVMLPGKAKTTEPSSQHLLTLRSGKLLWVERLKVENWVAFHVQDFDEMLRVSTNTQLGLFSELSTGRGELASEQVDKRRLPSTIWTYNRCSGAHTYSHVHLGQLEIRATRIFKFNVYELQQRMSEFRWFRERKVHIVVFPFGNNFRSLLLVLFIRNCLSTGPLRATFLIHFGLFPRLVLRSLTRLRLPHVRDILIIHLVLLTSFLLEHFLKGIEVAFVLP
mmetsp:Transcript_43676/g.170885  ORF Transcript_43676/g.170885 Transcript_43676/m.170885 type:complete len:246 (+) Transcript_43676:2679-3416(+)